jgi:hypothetical protein
MTGTCPGVTQDTYLSIISAINKGSTINNPMAIIMENTTVNPIITFSALSPNLSVSHCSNLSGSSE